LDSQQLLTEPWVQGGALRSASQACLHVHRTFITETDKTASAILPTTADRGGSMPPHSMAGL